MRKFTFVYCLLLFAYCLLSPRSVFADYVLPYPSYLPGNKMYTVSRMIDQVKKFWYWGSIAGVKYHMGLADKYLVEAKTLFEYKQYLLAADALKRSDSAFQQISQLITRVHVEGKDTSVLEKTYNEAADVHIEVLQKLLQNLPAEFIWTPEKAPPTNLPLQQLLLRSIEIRTRK